MTNYVETWARECEESLKRSRERRAQPPPFPWHVVVGVLYIVVAVAIIAAVVFYLKG